MDWEEINVDTNGTFKEGLVGILDNQDQFLGHKTVRLVKMLWQHRGMEEETWELEGTMRTTYPFLFRDEGTWHSRSVIK